MATQDNTMHGSPWLMRPGWMVGNHPTKQENLHVMIGAAVLAAKKKKKKYIILQPLRRLWARFFPFWYNRRPFISNRSNGIPAAVRMLLFGGSANCGAARRALSTVRVLGVSFMRSTGIMGLTTSRPKSLSLVPSCCAAFAVGCCRVF